MSSASQRYRLQEGTTAAPEREYPDSELTQEELRGRLDTEKMERARERQRNAGEMLRLMGFADKQADEVETLARKFQEGTLPRTSTATSPSTTRRKQTQPPPPPPPPRHHSPSSSEASHSSDSLSPPRQTPERRAPQQPRRRSPTALSGTERDREKDRGEIARLRRQLEEERDEHHAELDEVETHHQAEMAELWDEHWRRVAALEAAHSDEALRETVRAFETENAELKEHIEELQAQPASEELRKDIEKKNRRLHTADTKQRELQNEVATLQDEVEENLHTLAAQQQLLDARSDEIEALQDQLRRAKEKADKQDNLRSLVDTQKQEISRLQASLERELRKPKQQDLATARDWERGSASSVRTAGSAQKVPLSAVARRSTRSRTERLAQERDDSLSQSRDSDMCFEEAREARDVRDVREARDTRDVRERDDIPRDYRERPAPLRAAKAGVGVGVGGGGGVSTGGYASSNNESDRESRANARSLSRSLRSQGSASGSARASSKEMPQHLRTVPRVATEKPASLSTPANKYPSRSPTPSESTSPNRVPSSTRRSPGTGSNLRLETLRSEYNEARSERLMLEARTNERLQSRRR